MLAPAWLIRFLQTIAFGAVYLFGTHLAETAPHDGTDRGVRFWFALFGIAAAFAIQKMLRPR